MCYKMKTGFTLIELLVVVLIIGLLAAVALPQYNKAVMKARVAEYEVNLKSIANAAHACKLQKGNDCTIDELDIDVPECKVIPGIVDGATECEYTTTLSVYTGTQIAYPVTVKYNNQTKPLLIYLISPTSVFVGLEGSPATGYHTITSSLGGLACYDNATLCAQLGFSNKVGGFYVR